MPLPIPAPLPAFRLSNSAWTQATLVGLAKLGEELSEIEMGRKASTKRMGTLVHELSQVYTVGRGDLQKATGREHLEARLRFFLARDALKCWTPLREIWAAGMLPAKKWNVLDLGAGVGATAAGVSLFAGQAGVSELQFTLVEPDPACTSVLSKLPDRLTALAGPAVTAKVAATDARTLPAIVRGQKYDLILLGFALNEMFPEEETDNAEAFVEKYLRHLTPSGKLLVLEPALRAPSRKLHRLRDLLAAEGRVFAPCLGIEGCPMLARKRDWCHEDVLVSLPEPLRSYAKSAGLRFERLTYSYLTLGTDGRGLGDDLEPTTFRAVSRLRKSKGKLELNLCGKSTAPTLMRLDRHRSDANASLDEVARGDIVSVPTDSPEGSRVRVRAEDAFTQVLGAEADGSIDSASS